MCCGLAGWKGGRRRWGCSGEHKLTHRWISRICSLVRLEAPYTHSPLIIAVFPKLTTVSATTCSALSAVATGASLAAYFSESGAVAFVIVIKSNCLWVGGRSKRSPRVGCSGLQPHCPCLPIAEASRDPAWLTAAVLAGLPIVYSMLVG